jgi:hypothetical protein
MLRAPHPPAFSMPPQLTRASQRECRTFSSEPTIVLEHGAWADASAPEPGVVSEPKAEVCS